VVLKKIRNLDTYFSITTLEEIIKDFFFFIHENLLTIKNLKK